MFILERWLVVFTAVTLGVESLAFQIADLVVSVLYSIKNMQSNLIVDKYDHKLQHNHRCCGVSIPYAPLLPGFQQKH